MNNNAVLTILSDAIDLQKQTLEVLKEAVAVLKAAVDELKASRNVTITTPQYDPYAPYNPPLIQPNIRLKPWGDSITISHDNDFKVNGTVTLKTDNVVYTNACTPVVSSSGLTGR